MDPVLAALEGTAIAQALRVSRWGYAAVNGTHILGIALLVGSIVPLNLRTFGLWPRVPREALARVLVPMAASGLFIAVMSGSLLFSVRAPEYAALGIVQVKLSFVALGTLAAIWLHARQWLTGQDASHAALIGHAAISTACWITALACGRLIAFSGD